MKQNACICYITCLRDVNLLIRSLALLHNNWSYAKDYDTIVFHDDLTPMHISKINVELHRNLGYVPNIKWTKIQFNMPSHVSTDPSKYIVDLREFWMGYRHMCNFHSWEIYEKLKDYEYYLRLDSDSYILGPINIDLFDFMKQNDLSYGYMRDEDREVPRVAIDLWETTKKFMADNNVDRSIIDNHLVNGEWDLKLFYTNFEISRVDTFYNEKYKKYYDCLNQTGKIYYNRWGDAPIHWFGVRMFVPDNKVWSVSCVPYQHNNWVKNLRSIPILNNLPCTSQLLNKYIDGSNEAGRLGRFNYAWARYMKTGIDGVNWGD